MLKLNNRSIFFLHSMPTIEEYFIFQLSQITKYGFTVRAFVIHRIICKKLFEPLSDPPNFEGEPSPAPMHLPFLPPPPTAFWAGLTFCDGYY